MRPKTIEPTNKFASERDTGSPIGDSDTCTTAEVQVPARNRRRGSIRLRLASLVVACVLPVWIAAGFLVYYNYQSRRALTEQRMLETSRALTLVVDRELANIQAGLSILATSPSLVSGDLPAFYRRAQVVLESHPDLTSSFQTRPPSRFSIRLSHLARRCLSKAPRIQFAKCLRQVGRLSPTSTRAQWLGTFGSVWRSQCSAMGESSTT
jgi:hypothetical protein